VNERVIDGIAIRETGDPAAPGILLWPGLGSAGYYFDAIAQQLPGRSVAVDPPGFGRSPRPGALTLERLLEQAFSLCEACGCAAVVGHSLGGQIALELAARPPRGLRAAVSIDGGFLSRADVAELGMPTGSGLAALTDWMAANMPRFPDWPTAIRELASMLGSEPTAAIEAYARQYLRESADGIAEAGPPELLAQTVLAVIGEDPAARGAALAVPVLLIACGLPVASRATRQRAWEALARSSPLIELEIAEAWTHNPVLQDPGGAASLIGDWLAARIRQRRVTSPGAPGRTPTSRRWR
jgi:pimeloyl-ACP methyl ester carboxylesterase